MSNRRKLTPPPSNVVAYAAAYRCSDCTGVAERIRLDQHGIWHVEIEHDDGCPVLAGRTPSWDATVAAAQRARIKGGVAVVGVRDGR